jgi:D-glycero-D-manno-heptose 1,7-bisphosphate phosphatase
MGSGKREGSAPPFPGCNNASPKGGERGIRGRGRGLKDPVARASSPWEPSSSPENIKRPAVFLDRDGTINEEMGYINHLSRFRLLPEAAPAIRRLNEAGVPVVVVTNQSGAARGYFPASLVDEVHRLMHQLLARAGARIDAVYACLHAPDAGCPCRKPQPGLLLQAAQDLGLDLSRSYLVGDRYMDIQTAANAGAQGILVLTGYGLGEYEHNQVKSPAQPAHVADNLLDAVEFILAQRLDFS